MRLLAIVSWYRAYFDNNGAWNSLDSVLIFKIWVFVLCVPLSSDIPLPCYIGLKIMIWRKPYHAKWPSVPPITFSYHQEVCWQIHLFHLEYQPSWPLQSQWRLRCKDTVLKHKINFDVITAALKKDRPEKFLTSYCHLFFPNHTTKEKPRTLQRISNTSTESQTKREISFLMCIKIG